MRRDLMAIIVCPMCWSKLRLTVEREEGEEIVSGSLQCTGCGQTYPIVDTIPNLLPPENEDPAKES